MPRLRTKNAARKAMRVEDFMNFSRSVPAIIVTLFLHAGGMHAAEQASCTCDAFSAPAGYTFSQVQGVSDDGTVVGQ